VQGGLLELTIRVLDESLAQQGSEPEIVKLNKPRTKENLKLILHLANVGHNQFAIEPYCTKATTITGLECNKRGDHKFKEKVVLTNVLD
jgi:hypothetical protein